MSLRTRDTARRFQRERTAAIYGGNESRVALGLGISRQALQARQSIRYDELGKLAEDPRANPYAVVAGALAVIEESRATGDAMTLAERLNDLLATEQHHDGREDEHQQRVTKVLGSLAFMADGPTLCFRRKACAELEAWITEEMAHVDAALNAVGHARALLSKLSPVGEEG